MKNWIASLLILVLFTSAAVPSFATTIEPLAEPERYIVFFKDEMALEGIEENGGEIVQSYASIKAATVVMEPAKLDGLLSLGVITGFQKEHKFEASAQITPWAHTNMNIPAKVPATLTGAGIKVAIVDTGVDSSHPDLTVKEGVCTLDDSISVNACSKSFLDENGHGTHVAGIIAAKNNDIGIVGVAPGAEIYAVKALDGNGDGTTSTIMAGIDWAIRKGVHIINMSLTTPYPDMGIKAMVDKANANGIMVIAAAGNEGTFSGSEENVEYPAKFPSVIAVASTKSDNRRSSSSATGQEIELAAPGEMIYSTIPTSLVKSGYGSMSGTSMAAPFVAGMAALYKEKFPGYTNDQIRSLLQKNAKDLGMAGRDRLYGFGLIQTDKVPVDQSQAPITFTTAGKGSLKLNMQPVLEKYQAYSVYRDGRLISNKATSATFEDYGKSGSIKYMIYPWLNGSMLKDKVNETIVSLSSPVIPDLDNSVWYSRNMMYLYSVNILKGDAFNQLQPANNVTRAEAIAMVGRALGLNGTQRATRFSDVPSSSFASGFIQSAYEQGIISGRADKTFRPNEFVTRAEMAIMLSKAYKLPDAQTGSFSDVPAGMAGYQQIYNLAAAKITTGYTDGTFKPNEKMQRSTYSVFLSKANNPALK
ncbi:S8 family serine peptidase [Bacillus sp. ISL-45]|uniref:S8 family peptidase n=1 Tax=Bacillus sp. ISL-45 TaxID=2819128 RepID=UPI001BECD9D7|nr:S8 family serine peptidase [Bacillus sp. ISL-45]MBT2661567.1 S8 family serine peptidase [Bacillus sp. ISL-45]